MRIPSASVNDPLLLGFDIASASTLMEYTDYFVVYMHSRGDQAITYTFRFLLDPLKANACFSRIDHDFSTATPEKKFESIINKPILDSLSYLQGLSGVYTKLTIPGLEQLKNDPTRVKSALNKAALTIPIHYDGEIYTSITIPEKLFLRYVNASGVKEIIPDYYIDNYHDYFGGKLDTTLVVYKFNISNFIQNYLDDKENVLKPELEVFQSVSDVRNVIFKANDSKTKAKLNMTLTNF